jgi:pyruvate formate lyase activating enzyme
MNREDSGRVFDIQRFSVHDGPGIRTDVFLKGCPLRCLWCHSPEPQALEAQIGFFEIRCIGIENCGKCLGACPVGALKKGRTTFSETAKASIELVELDRRTCDSCGKCAVACPAKALCMAGTDMTLDEVMKAIERDRPYYRKSGGGVTLSGGEPMVQHRFTAALLKECKNQGLHTCLDTTGHAPWERYREVAPYVDLFLYDLKHMDAGRSQALTGVSNERILDNARRLAAEGAALQIRIPVIPGCNDSEQNLRATSEFCKALGPAVKSVQILPYHRLGMVKYERLQLKYQLVDVMPPTKEHMEFCKEIVKSYGLIVQMN